MSTSTSSRLIVRNLPAHADNSQLRSHFASRGGTVTDAKVVMAVEGERRVSRRFGFVGFRTGDEAEQARRWFDKTYMDTSKLQVEFAKGVASAELSRPWSKYSKGSSAYAKAHGEDHTGGDKTRGRGNVGRDKRSEARKAMEEDEGFREFLNVVKGGRAGQQMVWSNGDGVASAAGGMRGGVKKKHKRFDADAEEGEEEHETANEEETKETIKISKATKLARDNNVSDDAYLKSRIVKDFSDDEEEEEEEGEEEDSDGANDGNRSDSGEDDIDNDDEPERENLPGAPSTSDDGASNHVDASDDACRLFIRNLPYTCTEEELKEIFDEYGTVSNVHIVVDKGIGKSKGIAFVSFAVPEEAAQAEELLDRSVFQGRLMHVMKAKSQGQSARGEGGDHGKGKVSFKEQKEAARKLSAGDKRAWNALFMRSDTVAARVAERYGIEKSALLNADADGMAVKLALGETQVVAETKKSLEENGVNVELLENAAKEKNKIKRSATCIIIKNLPVESSEHEILEMFDKFGSIATFVLPTTRTMAIVDFHEKGEAKKAFQLLAYSRYHDVPLFLEWAPDGLLPSSGPAEAEEEKESEREKPKSSQKPVPVEAEEEKDEQNEQLTEMRSRVVYVKNLAFGTSEEELRSCCMGNKLVPLAITVVKKKDTKTNKMLSLGYGFVEFDSADAAIRAAKRLHGVELNGHNLDCKISAGTSRNGKPSASKTLSTPKILVRNVPFQATKKELQALFTPFGHVKSFRLPRKFDGSHRGFAFVEYATRQEASSAAEALAATHLYGRHIVIEAANEADSIEELRQKTRDRYDGDEKVASGSKRQRQV